MGLFSCLLSRFCFLPTFDFQQLDLNESICVFLYSSCPEFSELLESLGKLIFLPCVPPSVLRHMLARSPAHSPYHTRMSMHNAVLKMLFSPLFRRNNLYTYTRAYVMHTFFGLLVVFCFSDGTRTEDFHTC